MARSNIGKYDSIIIGGLLGLMVGWPAIAETVKGWIVTILPDSMLVFGDMSIGIYAVAIGLIIGYIVERT